MKNEDMKNELLAKKTEKSVAIEFDDLELIKEVERKRNELPVLTEAELDELKVKVEVLGHEAAEKGCWLGLGSFRMEGSDIQADMVHASGSVAMLALLVAKAMNSDPGLEQAFMLAVGLRIKHGGMTYAAEIENNNEEEE